MNLKKEEIEGKRVIEVGSYNVNGSVRPLVESYNPREYIGVDISKGPGVDVICRVEDLESKFGNRSFDVVISTELLEHVKDWKAAIHNIKNICKDDGIILITTRSYGFVYHGHPYDYWRYEINDMKHIFQDCIIKNIDNDPQQGVCIKCIKPQVFSEEDLSSFELYSIAADRRVKEVHEADFSTLHLKKIMVKEIIRRILYKLIYIFK